MRGARERRSLRRRPQVLYRQYWQDLVLFWASEARGSFRRRSYYSTGRWQRFPHWGFWRDVTRWTKSDLTGGLRHFRVRYASGRPRRRSALLIGALLLGIGGVAVANAFVPAAGIRDAAVIQQSVRPESVPSAQVAVTVGPSARTSTPVPTRSPRRTERARHPAPHVVASAATPTPSQSPRVTADCPRASVRLARGRALLRHPDSLPDVSVVTEEADSGPLATADLGTRTVTLYLRSCAEESATKLALAWMYEVGQIVKTDTWDSATELRWRRLRGGGLPSPRALLQDAAAVYAYWQTGSTESWQSPIPPPSASQLSRLATYLDMR